MNSIIIAVGALVWFSLGYRIYGRLIEKRVIEPHDECSTPAVSLRDNIDFFPAKRSLLFGHHFSSIAGAGPIIGPVIAVFNFGWLGVLGWIWIGSILIGGVHDYVILMVSVKHQGASVATIAEKTMGKGTKIIFAVFLWLALILVVSVFGVLGAVTLVEQPEVVIPSLSLIGIAVLTGYLIYRVGMGTLPATLIGIGLLVLCIWIGYKFPVITEHYDLKQGQIPLVIPGFHAEGAGLTLWFTVLMLYSLCASIVPVWVLLQPRDYLASFQLYIGLLVGFLGICFARETLKAPSFISLNSAEGPIWPMLFVIVACGAVSGFHSLVASGTTSKQLSKESHGRMIGYGGMLLEGLLATIATLAVSAGLYWEIAPQGIDPNLVFQTAMEKGWIVAFGYGFGNLAKSLPFLSFTSVVLFAIIMLNAFIFTTLDTGVRISRFVFTEFTNVKNMWIAALISVGLAFILGITNSWKAIWPIFGSCNQLIAALTLFVVTTYLIGIKRPTSYTLYPGIVMVVTTICALVYQIHRHFTAAPPKILLGSLSLVLLALALYVLYEVIVLLRRQREGGKGNE